MTHDAGLVDRLYGLARGDHYDIAVAAEAADTITRLTAELAAERAAVVAWLRAVAGDQPLLDGGELQILRRAANMIEHCDHVKEDGNVG